MPGCAGSWAEGSDHLMPTTAQMADREVRRAVRASLADLAADDLVLVACSGGPDSLALARAVAAERSRAGAIVVDHGLQQGSADVAERAAEQCRALGLDPVEVVAVHLGEQVPGRGGPEAIAREARRAALADAADHHAAAAILLAHTRDDQAETVLLRLARGAGARSLSAMAPIAGVWRRPLLGLDRALVHSALGDLQAWTDPHNTDPSFARVRVRGDVLPAMTEALGPGVVAGLVRSAELLRDDAEALERIAEQEWSGCCIAHTEGITIELDLDRLSVLPRAVRTRLLRRAAIETGAPPSALTRDHILAVEALISDWHGQGPLDLPGPLRASRGCGRLRFDRSDPLGSPPRA